MPNFRWKYFLIVSLLLNVTFLMAAGVQYIGQSGSAFEPSVNGDNFLFEKLSLRPEQAKAMREKAVQFHPEIGRRRLDISEKKRQLITLLRADRPDVKAIDAVTAEISAMQEEMQRKITAHVLEAKAVMDKEQQKRFLNLLETAMTEGRQAGCWQAERH